MTETEDAMVCSAVEVLSDVVQNVIEETDSSSIDRPQAMTISSPMRTCTYGQEIPNDAGYISSNGYPLPRLSFM